MSIDVDAANPSAAIADVLTDRHGNHPVRVDITSVLCPDGDTEIYFDVSENQAGLGLTGVQLFGICDRFGNPRATLTLHPFEGQPGEDVEITVSVDDGPASTITVRAVDGIPMQYPWPMGNARQFVHIPPKPDTTS